jgi:integrase
MASITKNKKGERRIIVNLPNGERKAIYLGKIPLKDVQEIKTKVEAIVTAGLAQVSVPPEVAVWLGKVGKSLHQKLANVGLVEERQGDGTKANGCLKNFLDSYIDSRTDAKQSTLTFLGHTRRCLIAFFGAKKKLSAITAADAEKFRRWLKSNEKLAASTIRRRCTVARQFFKEALNDRLIQSNPFGAMKGIGVKGNRTRDFNVDREMAQQVLDACPDAEWRLLFALSRFGGLRCPSEHLALCWGDIDFANGRMTVHSPKTAHHEGKESRLVPLFPELLEYLEDARELAGELANDPTAPVISRYRSANANLRTQLQRIIKRAGLTPWPKLFQNLRATRETELAEKYPIHVVCAWIGNSPRVANESYLQVTEAHFKSAQKPTRQTTRSAAEPEGTDWTGEDTTCEFPGDFDNSRDSSGCLVGGTGLEPVTSTV